MKTFVIAEAGANHNRDWRTAKKLICAAAASGAQAVKFQNYTSSKLYSKSTPDFGVYKNIPELISSIELPKEWSKELKKVCDDYDIEFMSTPFDEESVELLYSVGVKRMKIASFEATDSRLIKAIAATKLPVIFSAGIGIGLEQVARTIQIIHAENPSADVTVLHCNSSYPTPFSDINLGQMLSLKEAFGIVATIGLSDHTEGVLVPPVAVALGASVIEKHFTLSRKMQGPDHPFAIEPDELIVMCKNIATIETAMGKKTGNDLTDSENKNQMSFARRSVVANKAIKAGEILTRENLTTKRPFLQGNVPADMYEDVIGSILKVDVEEDQMLNFNHIEKK